MDLINIRPLKRKNLMGESKKDALRVNFDRKLKLEFHGVKVTSDAGLYPVKKCQGSYYLQSIKAIMA